MTTVTEAEWEEIEGFETTRLLRAVDLFDAHRPRMSQARVHELRDQLLELHQLSMSACNGSRSEVGRLFSAAQDLQLELEDVRGVYDQILETLEALLELAPAGLEYDDTESG